MRSLSGSSTAQTYMPKTRTRALSTACSSRASRRPAESPKRSGSTTVVCSTSTLVGVPPTVILGLKYACRAAVDVGETRTVLSPRNSSAWTTTAYRVPRCSWPCACRGAGKRKISPRTKMVRRSAVPALPSAREWHASPRDQRRPQQVAARRRRSKSVPDGGLPPRGGPSEPPRNHSALHHV
jgi:hypothetical protein